MSCDLGRGNGDELDRAVCAGNDREYAVTMQDRGNLLTEQLHPHTGALDALPTGAAFDLMNAEDRTIADAVAEAKAAIVAAIERIATAFRGGGRLIYVGAGTSGRLGVLDASECPPTFLTAPEQIVGVIAGGDAALKRSAEHREDDADAGGAALRDLGIVADDVVVGISAGGTTPFVHGALAAARDAGAGTVFLACVPADEVPDEAEISIRVLTGPEVVSGSTRLKAGLATKMVLNMLSTLALVRVGKVFGNLMVDVNARGCAKLTDRAVRITAAATGVDRPEAAALLERAGWHVKTAIVMQRARLDREAAQALLQSCDDNVRTALARAERGG